MLDLNFTVESHEFGKVTEHELKEGGRNIPVTDENKLEYVMLVAQFKMSNGIRKQIDSFLEGFHELIPPELISIFSEKELELLICGMPDIDCEFLEPRTPRAYALSLIRLLASFLVGAQQWTT